MTLETEAGRPPPATATRQHNRRRHPRFQLQRFAALRFGPLDVPVPCELLDISISGARFKPISGSLSGKVNRRPIEVELEGMLPVRAWPVWRRKGQIGVHFIANSFGKPTNAALAGAGSDSRYEQRERIVELLKASGAAVAGEA